MTTTDSFQQLSASSFSDFIGSNPFYFIAEIGINHNGSLELAKELIDEAVAAGCHAVKFQKRTIDIVYKSEFLASFRESPWGTTQRDQKEALEFGQDEYDEIDRYCSQVGIAWSASAWDIPSQNFLSRYKLPFNKVASAMATNHDFLHVVAQQRTHTFMSTGMMSYDEVKSSIEIFEENKCPLSLFHTVSTYPTEESSLNLNNILELSRLYGLEVGYSGHESTITPTLIASVLGARVLERHITLNRAMYGSDQSASVEPRGLRDLIAMLHKVPICRGSYSRQLSDQELQTSKKLRYWNPS